VAREFLKAGLLAPQIERIREVYAVKRDAMLAALERHMDPSWGVRWTRPEGGLFLWVELPHGIDAGELLETALKAKVAFVTGSAFHCDGSGRNTMRLNFSYPRIEQIDVAIDRLARCIGSRLREGTLRFEVAAPADPSLVSGDHALEQLAWNLALSEVVT
jgi:2-aminoadipate transaminase